VARGALRDVRTVTRDERPVSLRAEADGAAALLAAAGVDARISVNLPGLTAPAEQVLAWTVREGVTNMLRHSDARTCSITGGRDGDGGTARLEIINDNARPPSRAGAGLADLAERARAVSRVGIRMRHRLTAGSASWSGFPGKQHDPGADRVNDQTTLSGPPAGTVCAGCPRPRGRRPASRR
jgi:two-component system, NarL family, sensor histidine kinase DesK